ncbi:MAG: 16S rRNA (guanine(527)-N(7))-methyltransferase RsmG [Bacteroidota bacterium]
MIATPVSHYFSYLSPRQQTQLQQLAPLYQAWNTRLNLISRKDIANLDIRHVLYSLSIAKIVTFKPSARILDVGTGGGFPGIPLAILFPQVHFHLIDSVNKKIKAVQGIAQTLSLQNVTTQPVRAEVLGGTYDFVLGRAVTNLPTFYTWVKDKISPHPQHEIPNGILYLKGKEPIALPLNYRTYAIGQFFREPFFQTKQLVHIYP